MAEKLLTPFEVADELDCSPIDVMRWANRVKRDPPPYDDDLGVMFAPRHVARIREALSRYPKRQKSRENPGRRRKFR